MIWFDYSTDDDIVILINGYIVNKFQLDIGIFVENLSFAYLYLFSYIPCTPPSIPVS